MLHHYITKYQEDRKRFAESWIQINLFGKCFCLSKKRILISAKTNEINFEDFEKIIIETDEKNPITVATLSSKEMIPEAGYRIRVKPKD